MKDIEKQFAGAYALRGVHFELREGEVHAILGENGAGKSTLIKVLGGIYKADKGSIYINGEEAKIDGVKDAQDKGISIIHQEIVLVPELSVAENIFLGQEPSKLLWINDRQKMNDEARSMIKALDLNIDVTQKVKYLTIAQRQMVEIIKAVSFHSKIIVMDEPTSSIDENEVEYLFEIILKLKAQGVGIIYISHKMDELIRIADRITVLRDGTYIDTRVTSETTIFELISLMVGRKLTEYYKRTEHKLGDVYFEVQNLCSDKVFHDVSFQVRKGEVVGFSGLVGAGRSEIMKAIFKVDSMDSGKVLIAGKEVRLRNVRDAIRHGIALIPEDRKKEGLVLKNTVTFNLTLAVQDKFKKGLIVHTKIRDEIVDKYIHAFSIKTPSPNQLTNNLSGGNQQKVVLGKWLATDPKILILDEPTRGVDVGAKGDIYEIIDNLANEGMAVIVISSELPELINMCDRIYVVFEGKIAGELNRDEFSQEKIMHFATGGTYEEH